MPCAAGCLLSPSSPCTFGVIFVAQKTVTNLGIPVQPSEGLNFLPVCRPFHVTGTMPYACKDSRVAPFVFTCTRTPTLNLFVTCSGPSPSRPASQLRIRHMKLEICYFLCLHGHSHSSTGLAGSIEKKTNNSVPKSKTEETLQRERKKGYTKRTIQKVQAEAIDVQLLTY